jgi:hypothetical protein
MVIPALADAAEGAARRLQEPLSGRIAHLIKTGELPAHLDAEQEPARLRVLLDGLRIHPRRTSPSWALSLLDDHLAALATLT